MSSEGSRQDASVEHNATPVSEIKEKIHRGVYRPDERAVADAILRRRRELASLRAQAVAICAVEDHAAVDPIDD